MNRQRWRSRTMLYVRETGEEPYLTETWGECRRCGSWQLPADDCIMCRYSAPTTPLTPALTPPAPASWPPASSANTSWR